MTTMTTNLDILKNVTSDDPVQVPTITSIFKVLNIEQVEAFFLRTRISYCPGNFIPISPFLLEKVKSE